MLDFLMSFFGGFASKYFWFILLLLIGFISGALVFRNNPETGESYAQKFLAVVGSIVQSIINLKDRLTK